MRSTYVNYILMGVAALAVVYVLWGRSDKKPLKTLPYYGPSVVNTKGDTIFHSIPDFNFIDQKGRQVTQNTVKDKIYVADYFFTTCQSICPVMSTQMQHVYKTFIDNNDVLLLSHTVDPETDSVTVLNDYAEKHNASADKWYFLTGDKKNLYEIARKGYLLDAQEGNGGPEDFIHTQNFALIDKERHIRGYYDGTDSTEIDKLINDIRILLNEYEFNEEEK